MDVEHALVEVRDTVLEVAGAEASFHVDVDLTELALHDLDPEDSIVDRLAGECGSRSGIAPLHVGEREPIPQFLEFCEIERPALVGLSDFCQNRCGHDGIALDGNLADLDGTPGRQLLGFSGFRYRVGGEQGLGLGDLRRFEGRKFGRDVARALVGKKALGRRRHGACHQPQKDETPQTAERAQLKTLARVSVPLEPLGLFRGGQGSLPTTSCS